MKPTTEIEYNIGDIVRVRKWDDMVDEYSLEVVKTQIPFGFTKEMRKLCGKKYKITKKYFNRWYKTYGYQLDTLVFSFSYHMIKPYYKKPEQFIIKKFDEADL